jgi:hypothetical protein
MEVAGGDELRVDGDQVAAAAGCRRTALDAPIIVVVELYILKSGNIEIVCSAAQVSADGIAV